MDDVTNARLQAVKAQLGEYAIEGCRDLGEAVGVLVQAAHDLLALAYGERDAANRLLAIALTNAEAIAAADQGGEA